MGIVEVGACWMDYVMAFVGACLMSARGKWGD